MSRHVTRWGRSAYETAADLELERQAAEALGLGWSAWPDHRSLPPNLGQTDVLVINSHVRLDDRALEGFRGSLVLTTTSGYDHVDVAACRRRDVGVGRCPEARRDAVVEHALAGMGWWARRFDALGRDARAGHWARGDLPALACTTVGRSTVAVVGQGVIGRRMIEVLRVLGARVLAVSPRSALDGVERVDLDEALGRADIVTLHCNRNPSSEGMFGVSELARMRSGALLVNTARGRLVDIEAAVASVRAGHLGGLVLDVFPEEPWPSLAEHATVPGVLLTPHGAGYVPDLGARIAREVGASLAAWSRGEALPYPVT